MMREPEDRPAPPAARRRPAWQRAVRAAAIAAVAIAVAAGACVATVGALWRSEEGTRWLLAHVPGLTVVDVRGALGGGELRIGSLRAVEGSVQVDITNLRLAGLDLHWHPHRGAWIGASFAACMADAVRITPLPAKTPARPAAVPQSLRSPVAIDVASLRVDALAIADNAPLRDVQAALSIGAEGGRLHRVQHLRFAWERVQAEGDLIAQTDAPFAVDVVLAAHDAPQAAAYDAASASAPALPHWSAKATLRGPLAGFDAAASLQGEALAGRAAPQATASAHVTPFAPLPVSQVLLKTTELDLRALSERAPATRLQGSLRIATTRPAALDADLRNLAPAAWSSGGLPFASLTTHLEAPWSGEFIAIPSLRLVLADDRGAGGELRAQGRWEGTKAQLQLDLDQVQPARLDAHVAAWRIAGPLRAELEHLPPPAALWHAGATPAPASAAAAASAPAGAFAGVVAHVTGRLSGSAPALSNAKNAVAPPAMALQLDALLRADALQLKQFDLKAGTATVTATGALDRGRDGTWQGELKAQWAQLDPGAWWRLADSGPLHDGPNLLNGTLALHVADAPAAWQGLAGVHATADLVLADSLLAGLHVDGKAGIDGLHAPWGVAAEVRSGGNQARIDGAIRPGSAGADALAVIEQLHLVVDAPQLQVLAPPGRLHIASPAVAAASAVNAMAATGTLPGQLAARAATRVATGGQTSDSRALVPAAAASAARALEPLAPLAGRGSWPTRGSAKLDVQVSGDLAIGGSAHGRRGGAAPLRIVTQGELSDWVGPQFKLAKLQWNGRASSDPQAPLEATVTLADGQLGVARVTHAQATLSGTLGEHRLQLDGEAPVSPPSWLAHLANIGNANATRLAAVLQGRWRPEAVNTPAWQGHVAQFDLRAANDPRAATPGTTPASAAAAAVAASAPTVVNPNWVHVRPFDLSLSRDAAGDWQTLRVAAGAAEFAGLTLNWQPSFWTAPATPGASAHWAVDAALAPFSVAQIMARAQPDLGWHGDLQVAAQLHAAFDGQWHVAAQLGRTSGDLSVTELVQDPTAAKQALGLTRATASVKAEGLHWVADADVAGTRLGELSGHWTAEAASAAALPTPQSPLHGNVRAHVDDLNVWGAWLPPGWRLGGELRTDLALSGRWNDPQLTGELVATRLAIRNALEGVYGRDGEAAIRLTGDQALIERFRLQGGNGELTIAGGANLGAAPLARLQLQARQFQLLGRIDRKIVASGDLALQLGRESIKVDGKLGIDEGLFDLSKGGAPTLDADVEVLDGSSAAESGADNVAAAVPRPSRATQINLAVDLGDRLQLRGRGIATTLKGALRITSPNGVLAVRGNVHTAGGQYVAYGQKLDITRGEIAFSGPVADPRLDILAVRPNLDVVVGVAITGTALAPHVRLMSEPEMSDADKLSWLMLGRAPDTVGGADTALLQQAAMALLAGEGEAPSDQVLRRLGLTSFTVGQKTDTDNTKQTVVSLGRQVSRRVYVGYERSVAATAGNWQVIYRIAQRLTVRAQAGVDSSTSQTASQAQSWSLDTIYTWRWN